MAEMIISDTIFQGEDEEAEGLKISPLCDRSQHSEFAKSQRGKFNFDQTELVADFKMIIFGFINALSIVLMSCRIHRICRSTINFSNGRIRIWITRWVNNEQLEDEMRSNMTSSGNVVVTIQNEDRRKMWWLIVRGLCKSKHGNPVLIFHQTKFDETEYTNHL